MPSLPPASAFRSARKLHQSGLEAQTPDTITIGSRTYACAVTIGPVEPKMQEDGINYRNGQDATISVSKTLLATAPAARTTVTINEIEYRVVSTAGAAGFETAWRIIARRHV